MPDTPKLVAEEVLELTWQAVHELRHTNLLGRYLAEKGSFYYLITLGEFNHDQSKYFLMATQLKNVIADFINIKNPGVATGDLNTFLRQPGQLLVNPLQNLKNLQASDHVAGVEVRICLNGDELQIRYTVRDKDGKSLK